MQAVILCAGKGIRMGTLTKKLPKPLLQIKGKTLLEYKLERLPPSITEIILVIGFEGEKIRHKIGNRFAGTQVTYIEDKLLEGTAKALWQAKPILHNRFLVMMGDDIYSQEALEKASQHDFSITCIPVERNETGSRVLIDNNGKPYDFVTHLLYIRNHDDGGLVFTGLYSMTTDIFSCNPVKMETKDEWSLPKTFLQLGAKNHIEINKTESWIQITSPQDLLLAENQL